MNRLKIFAAGSSKQLESSRCDRDADEEGGIVRAPLIVDREGGRVSRSNEEEEETLIVAGP